MKLKSLVLAATMTQLAVVGALAPITSPAGQSADVGRGHGSWGDGLACAGCVVGGAIGAAQLGVAGSAILLFGGGHFALAAWTGIAWCATKCAQALK